MNCLMAVRGDRSSWDTHLVLADLFQLLGEPLSPLFGLFARSIVSADQQIADDGVLGIAERGHGDHCREPAPVLSNICQLVDVLDAARSLEHQCLEAGPNRGSELGAERLGVRDHFLRIGNAGRSDLVHHFCGCVTQHPLGAHIEDLDDAPGVGRDAREVRAVENRVLECAGLECRRFRSLDLGDVAGGSINQLILDRPRGAP